jgi:hypothetical protein
MRDPTCIRILLYLSSSAYVASQLPRSIRKWEKRSSKMFTLNVGQSHRLNNLLIYIHWISLITLSSTQELTRKITKLHYTHSLSNVI